MWTLQYWSMSIVRSLQWSEFLFGAWLGSVTFHTICGGLTLLKCAVSSPLFGQAVFQWVSAAVCIFVRGQLGQDSSLVDDQIRSLNGMQQVCNKPYFCKAYYIQFLLKLCQKSVYLTPSSFMFLNCTYTSGTLQNSWHHHGARFSQTASFHVQFLENLISSLSSQTIYLQNVNLSWVKKKNHVVSLVAMHFSDDSMAL